MERENLGMPPGFPLYREPGRQERTVHEGGFGIKP